LQALAILLSSIDHEMSRPRGKPEWRESLATWLRRKGNRD
jgi:hypothetical protein